KVLGFDELGFLAVDAAARFDEIGGIELVAAGIALVSARAISTANRADTFDVAVRQGAPGGRANGTGRSAFDDVSVAMQSAEKFLDRGVMVACRGARKQVVGQAQSLEIFDDHPVIPVGQLAGVRGFRIGLDKNRRAVLVGARDHQHSITRHALVPAEDIGWNPETGYVSDMAGVVGGTARHAGAALVGP